MRQATQAPTLAMEAKKMKVFGIVRMRLKMAKVTKMELTPMSDRPAPMRSRLFSVDI